MDPRLTKYMAEFMALLSKPEKFQINGREYHMGMYFGEEAKRFQKEQAYIVRCYNGDKTELRFGKQAPGEEPRFGEIGELLVLSKKDAQEFIQTILSN